MDTLNETPRPRRVRRALTGIRFQAPSTVVNGDTEETAPKLSGIESIILAYIPFGRRTLSKKLRSALETSVRAFGELYPSPKDLWETDPEFKIWAEDKLKALASLPAMNIQRAVYSLCQYDHPKYGFVKQSRKSTTIIEDDLDFGE